MGSKKLLDIINTSNFLYVNLRNAKYRTEVKLILASSYCQIDFNTRQN